MEKQVDVPLAWERLTVERLSGTLLIIGASDVGKTTFAHYLYQRLSAESGRVAFLDGDPGQSSLGLPTTMTLAVGLGANGSLSAPERVWQSFVGSTSPRGHMLPVLVGAARLVRAAYESGMDAVVYDTTGMIDPTQGGLALKLAKVELLRPTVVFAIQRARELEALLVPLRLSRRVRVVDLERAPAVQTRAVVTRQKHRAARFAGYFQRASLSDPLLVSWRHVAVLPAPRFSPHRLLAFEDADGFVLGLGIVLEADPSARRASVYTPLRSLEGVDALRLGDMVVDPLTFRDQFMPIE